MTQEENKALREALEASYNELVTWRPPTDQSNKIAYRRGYLHGLYNFYKSMAKYVELQVKDGEEPKR